MPTPLATLLLLACWSLVAEPAWAAKCGAQNQRPCKLWERIPSCDKGLVEDFGVNRCVKPRSRPAPRPQSKPACGAESQRPCTVLERIPSCNAGLVENFRLNRCVRLTHCGAEGQKPCRVWERIPSCDGSLKEDFKLDRCVRSIACGGRGQRPCTVFERIPSCAANLGENFHTNRCEALRPGETPFLAGLSSLSGEVAGAAEICEATLGAFPELKAGFGPLQVSATCQADMGVGFVCALPAAAGKIRDTAQLVQRINAEYNRSPCADELKFYAARARQHGKSRGLSCPSRDQFFDPLDGGTCWSCPSRFVRSITHVKSSSACVRASGTPGLFRAHCAATLAVLRDADKALRCFAASVRSGALRAAGGRGQERHLCRALGAEAYFQALDYLTGTPDPKTSLERLISRLRKVNSGLNSAAATNQLADKIGDLAECRGVLR